MAPSNWIIRVSGRTACYFDSSAKFIKVLTDGGFGDRFAEINGFKTNNLEKEFKAYALKVNKITNENKELDNPKPYPANLKFHDLVIISKSPTLDPDFEKGTQDDSRLIELFTGFFEGELRNVNDGKKLCQGCNQRSVLDKFQLEKGKRRDVCNSCRNKKQVANQVAKNVGVTEKKCNQCSLIKSISAFEKDRNICTSCRYISKKELHAEKEPETAPEKIASYDPCRTCKKVFQPEHFKYCKDKGRYDTQCRECYNAKNYSKDCRNKKKEEDLEGFKKQNAESHRDYVARHPEIIEENKKKRNMNLLSKLNMLKGGAKTRGYYWEIEDEEIMMQKLLQPCIYCGETVDETNGVLHGLDRVLNDKGYTKDNTVSC